MISTKLKYKIDIIDRETEEIKNCNYILFKRLSINIV
jgi:hypothetical protein